MKIEMKRQGIGSRVFLILLLLGFWLPIQAPAEAIRLKFSNYYPSVAPQSRICEEFIRDLTEQTGGQVSVQYIPGGALLNGPGMLKGVESGITDIGLSHIQYNPGRMPVTEACDQPHGFPSGWVAGHVVNDFFHKFRPREWDKVKVLFLFTNNPSVLVLTRPVRTMDDLKGLTIRAPGPIGEVIRSLGGSPAPTPIVETYEALSKGVVQGAFVAMETLKTFRFAEVAKYVTQAWHVGSTYTYYVAMNYRSYANLPPEIKEVVDRLSGEYAEKMFLLWNAIDFDGMTAGQERQLEFIDLSPEEFQRWQKGAAVVLENYVNRMRSAGYRQEEISGWLQFVGERNAFWTEKQLELKIRSVTGPSGMRPF